MVKYFVSWATTEYGYGNCIAELPDSIRDYDDILELQEKIRQREKIPEWPKIMYYRKVYDK